MVTKSGKWVYAGNVNEQINPNSTNIKQIQSYTLKGHLKVLDVKKLDKLRCKPFGYYDDLGCGLLLLE